MFGITLGTQVPARKRLLAFTLAQSVDDVVAKAIVARGGIKKIKSLNSQRLTGRISFSSGEGGPFSVEMQRPGKMRERLTLNGKIIIRTTNGKAGWIVNGDSDPARLQTVSPPFCRADPPGCPDANAEGDEGGERLQPAR